MRLSSPFGGSGGAGDLLTKDQIKTLSSEVRHKLDAPTKATRAEYAALLTAELRDRKCVKEVKDTFTRVGKEPPHSLEVRARDWVNIVLE